MVSESRSGVTFGLALANNHRIGGVVVPKRRTSENCRDFWTCVGFSHVKNADHREVAIAKRRTVVTFGLALRFRVSQVSTITGIDGVVVSKRKTIVTFGLMLGPRVSEVSTVKGGHRDRQGSGRETQISCEFWSR